MDYWKNFDPIQDGPFQGLLMDGTRNWGGGGGGGAGEAQLAPPPPSLKSVIHILR